LREKKLERKDVLAARNMPWESKEMAAMAVTASPLAFPFDRHDPMQQLGQQLAGDPS
jgi:hypothetical protein